MQSRPLPRRLIGPVESGERAVSLRIIPRARRLCLPELLDKCLVDNHYHGHAVPTPVTDGKRVFALFGSGVLAALDLDGDILWREELPRRRDVDGGVCSSPVRYKDSVRPAVRGGAT